MLTTSPMTTSSGAGKASRAIAASSRRHSTTRCASVVPALMSATGVSGARPCAISSSRDVREARLAHQHDERVDGGRQGGPVDGSAALVGIVVAGDDGERRREPAMRDRDAGVGRHRHRGAHAGHDLERNPGRRERFGFFAAAPEHERVAALQPDDAPARAARDARAPR